MLHDPLGPTERRKIADMPSQVLRNHRLLMLLLSFMRRPEVHAVGVTMRTIEPICLVLANYRKRRLYLCGGSTGRNPISSVCRFDPSSGNWEELPRLCEGRFLASAASCLGSIYVCGGSDGQQYLRSVERFNLDTSSWQSIHPMHYARAAAAALAIGGILYIFGGRDANSYLSSLECFDPRLDEWRGARGMAERRGYATGIRINHCLYAFGGLNTQGYLRSAERFDTRADLPEGGWESVPAMTVPRAQAVGFNLHGYAWLCGGSDGDQQLSSVTRYDPTIGQWDTYSPAMHSLRSCASVGVVKQQPYIVGGFDGQHFMKSAVRLDLEKRQWDESVLPMVSERAWAAYAVLEHHDFASRKSIPRIEYRTIAELEALAAELA
jgi:hypothetical protein